MENWLIQHIPLVTIGTGLVGILSFIFFLMDRQYHLKIEIQDKKKYFSVSSISVSGGIDSYSSGTPYWCLIARNTGTKKVMIESGGLRFRSKNYTQPVQHDKAGVEPGARIEVALKPKITELLLADSGSKPPVIATPIVITQTGKIFKGKSFDVTTLEKAKS